MRYALKEARLQNPVLTNRNGIRGIDVWGKQAHHCNALTVTSVHLCRYRSDWIKENVLTGGGLGKRKHAQEVSRGHSSYR